MNALSLIDGVESLWIDDLRISKNAPMPVYQYTEDDIDAIMSIYDMDDAFKQAFVRVKLSPPAKLTGKIGKSVNAHWRPIRKDLIAERLSNWCYVGDMGRNKLIEHIKKPNHIVGIIPFRLGLAVADIDKPEIEAVEAVTDALGTPLATFPTASGGWHSIYAIDNIHTATIIKSCGYKVDGVHLGEMCCLHRFANCWSPVNWLQSVKRRVHMDSSDYMLTTDIIETRLEWMGSGRVEVRRKPKNPNAPKYVSSITLDDAIEYFDLQIGMNPGEWQGHCPQCDPQRSGGGTRFKANMRNGRLLLNCFECAEKGFDGDVYWDMVRPLEQLARNKRIREILSDSIKQEK